MSYRPSLADDAAAFPTLDDSELAILGALGTRRSVVAGEYLYREGDTTYDFYVILSGAVEIVVRSDGEERIVARHGPGRFLGELNLLTGQRVYLSARVTQSGEVIVVPRAALQHVIATNPGLGDTILAAFLVRRSILLSGASGAIRVVSSRFSPESLRIREFLARNRIPHEWLDPDRDAAVDRLLREFSVTPGELPVVIASSSVLRRPTPGELAEYLGLTINSLPERCFDLVVVGAGPAGLAAAVYGASEGLRTLVVEMAVVGGQAGTSSLIENYLGFPTGISGGDLTQRAVVQAEKFGAHLTSPCLASSLREEAGHLVVRLSDGTEVASRAVIVASGVRYRRLDATRLTDFEGNGVYYAATEMEARLCAGSPVVVAGGGNSAGQAALFLAAAGSPITIVIRGHDLNASMSRYLVDRIEADARITVRTNTKIASLEGDQTLTSIRVTTVGGDVVLPCSALFSFIGADPAADWLSGCAALDEHGFVLTDRSIGEEHLDERWEALGRRPLPFETSYPGLFAVGDVRAGSIKRVAAAVGEGSASVRSVHEYLAFAH
ncbi:FAD-dependent oxidoreductase [Ktedonobacter racemifer]|uniref:Cyclic nucleotide-binding protein n=1 Tax=Ktedonobacter racemifer DSM 44963 TaxID=485913 RepID=D6TXE6_KTERA|nr:FAD-dependent oxidoreductase [Ktedonobacter racemifer]EFH84879.1 cyclic nucleotide-binding protein [Ktedonobacter racemifer DSM 44963]